MEGFQVRTAARLLTACSGPGARLGSPVVAVELLHWCPCGWVRLDRLAGRELHVGWKGRGPWGSLFSSSPRGCLTLPGQARTHTTGWLSGTYSYGT